MAKTIPAIGALKMEDIAPAAPQPTSVTRCRSFNEKNFAIFDPIAAPLITTGASGPAEPPLPMVRQLDINLEKLERNLNRPPYRDTL
jgi:hypothetical protein